MKNPPDPLGPARGCCSGILAALIFWTALALLVILALHFFPLWRLP
jgi:hypothetical protein